MNNRERLIELIHAAVGGCARYWAELIADYLIANAVTVREQGRWISITDCANAGVYCSVCHKKVYKEDYAWCNRKNKLRSDYCPNCGADMRESSNG